MKRHNKLFLYKPVDLVKPITSVILFATFLLQGCTQPHLYADLPPIVNARGSEKGIEVFETSHYHIYSSGNDQIAREIGQLLETLYQTCSNILGVESEYEKLEVYTYSDRNSYDRQLQAMGLSNRRSSGIYTPDIVPGIHLPLIETNDTHPYFSLVHEGVHQYLHVIKGLPLNEAGARLPSVPLWLSEGLALYLEASLVNTSWLNPGQIHPARLYHLKKLIQRKSAPRVETVLSKSYGDLFTNVDYSVSWGIVHFMHANDLWREFWNVWQMELDKEYNRFMQNYKKTPSDKVLELQKTWARTLGVLSYKVFRETIVDSMDWSDWQAHWQNSILRLTYEP